MCCTTVICGCAQKAVSNSNAKNPRCRQEIVFPRIFMVSGIRNSVIARIFEDG